MKDLRFEVARKIDDFIKDAVDRLLVPNKYLEIKANILQGRDETFGIDVQNMSSVEFDVFYKLYLNNTFRERELRRAMGFLLLYESLGPIEDYDKTISQPIQKRHGYSEQFWISYGDLLTKCSSLLDSIGMYLTFVFFGLVDSHSNFRHTMDNLERKYFFRNGRLIFEDRSFTLGGRVSWDCLTESRKVFTNIWSQRNEFIHSFSPLMYLSEDEGFIDDDKRSIVRYPELNAQKASEEAREAYYRLSVVPLAADDIAVTYIGTPSYHRSYR